MSNRYNDQLLKHGGSSFSFEVVKGNSKMWNYINIPSLLNSGKMRKVNKELNVAIFTQVGFISLLYSE